MTASAHSTSQVKTYFRTDSQPGDALSNTLDCIPIGEEGEIRHPTGGIIYRGDDRFSIEGGGRSFNRVSMILGSSGLAPGAHSLLEYFSPRTIRPRCEWPM